MDTCRKEFEKWAKERDYSLQTDAVGWYVDEDTDYAWGGWQAAWATREEDMLAVEKIIKLREALIELMEYNPRQRQEGVGEWAKMVTCGTAMSKVLDKCEVALSSTNQYGRKTNVRNQSK